MGYETTLLIGELFNFQVAAKTPEKYFQLISTLELCKTGKSAIWDLPWKNETPDEMKWYWYAPTGDGNQQQYEDRYGDEPQPVPVADVLEALEEDALQDNYRRFKWAIALLKSIQDTSPNSNFPVLYWSH